MIFLLFLKMHPLLKTKLRSLLRSYAAVSPGHCRCVESRVCLSSTRLAYGFSNPRITSPPNAAKFKLLVD